jgi:hypothetical protein
MTRPGEHETRKGHAMTGVALLFWCMFVELPKCYPTLAT